MSVDFELEPNITWNKISSAIRTNKLSGVVIMDNRKTEPWKDNGLIHLLNKGKRYLYAFDLGAEGVLFKEYGSLWSEKHPILDSISKHFGVKYYADIDSDEWEEHIKRTTKKSKTRVSKPQPQTIKVISVFGNIMGKRK